MAAIANLFIDQGSTFSTSVNVKNDDETHEPIEVVDSKVEIEKDMMLKISFGIDQIDLLIVLESHQKFSQNQMKVKRKRKFNEK